MNMINVINFVTICILLTVFVTLIAIPILWIDSKLMDRRMDKLVEEAVNAIHQPQK